MNGEVPSDVSEAEDSASPNTAERPRYPSSPPGTENWT